MAASEQATAGMQNLGIQDQAEGQENKPTVILVIGARMRLRNSCSRPCSAPSACRQQLMMCPRWYQVEGSDARASRLPGALR